MISRRSFLAATIAASVATVPVFSADPRRTKAGFLGGSHSHAPEKWRLVAASRDKDDLKDNNLAVFQFPKALGLILNSNLQHNSGRRRIFEVFGTNGSAILNPIEPPALEIDLAKAAGPYKAGIQTIPVPKYSRYAADIDDLAACIRGERKPLITLDEELRVQKWLLKACEMT